MLKNQLIYSARVLMRVQNSQTPDRE